MHSSWLGSAIVSLMTLTARRLDARQKKAPVEESYQEAIAKKTQGLKKVKFYCQAAINQFLEYNS
jgi:hypothetical protein